jgi:uncharacterized protein YndB with AHSA1/START domain
MQTQDKDQNSVLSNWSLDREVVLSLVINAPRELVFAAWADPQQIQKWFGPSGIEIESQEIDISVGKRWRFDMVAPDGTRYKNRMLFRRIEKPSYIEFDHGDDLDVDPGKFRMTVTFDQQSDGKTVITMRQLHPTKEQREAVIGFGGVEYGYQTLGKLAKHVESIK